MSLISLTRSLPFRSPLDCLAVLAALVWLTPAALAQEPATGAAPPMQVGVIEMQRQEVPRTVTLPGRAVAFEDVEIRPRVDGVVEEVVYKPGRPLKVGDPLYRIDDAAYRAEVAADAADLAKAEANLPVVQSAYERALKLEGNNYSAAQVDAARAELEEAKATLDAAQAALDYSRTQLSWTTIRSPIEGVPDISAVSVGDLVTAAQGDALTTVTRLDPIYVDMIETSARILSIRRQIEAGTLKMNDRLRARLVLETGQSYEGEGQLVTPGTSVATSTGTMSVRFRFDNPRRLILPGMFVRGEVTLGSVDAFLVPQRAAQRDSSGKLNAFVLAADDTAKKTALTEIGSTGNSWIVEDGIAPGDKLIVDGLKSMSDGQKVRPVTATLDENGLVQDAAPASSGAED
ncbi:efflux transporter periplasmic adaptor subunit [Rhodovulum sulfidophilum]|uniref:Efflux RND transporter periplasmic adaptor subunit n=1 Tax=Rhodovulum visakhapatnamense TaxID=364297 RepID=A0ABS1RKB0_9RHOB|nr:efflux RND transporter periplasmic adaptor subunit [Rhodovulum visakhapatnamense]MBL3569787.1 efflux RND transporter periplasmic adaptor subunit [Rhodovulum visakhapatnamense]MBL3580090.1 efflux RND transporter periplasmic adaptor subunit [Rhodovulum visakhapatnamense]OLS45228.1 efflux transporter periplasmic adaptor subunit [Rhodovulum sulfidophilum]